MQAATEPTRLIVLRGNSGSGKSSVAAEIRARYGRGIAQIMTDAGWPPGCGQAGPGDDVTAWK